MSGALPQLALVGALVLLNAAFAGTELALVSLREGQLQRLERRSATGALLARLARQPNQFLATIQIGITLAGFLASASAAVSLAKPLEDPLGFMGSAAEPASIVVVTLILSYVTLVLGELAPKRIAMQRAERWALLAARPLSFVATLTRPAVWLLSVSTDLAVRLLGGDPNREREEVTEEELRDMVSTQASFTPQQRTIIAGAFDVGDRTLHDVLRPRPDVLVLDPDDTCAQGRDTLVAHGRSRAPVGHDRSLDDAIGIVHLRDLLHDDRDCVVGRHVQPAMLFPESVTVLRALRDMQVGRTQMAIVINEHGGAEGIITVEDLVEEIVGEIYDEADRDVLSVRREPDGSLVLPGRFPVHDLSDIGVEAPEGHYATVAGFLLDRLGRLPEMPGDVVDAGPWRFTVTEVTSRAITEVRVSRREGAPGAGAGGEGAAGPDTAEVPEAADPAANGAGGVPDGAGGAAGGDTGGDGADLPRLRS
ncbi:MAG TPA: hemolysin family protein [Acidimicrobiales bacterium]